MRTWEGDAFREDLGDALCEGEPYLLGALLPWTTPHGNNKVSILKAFGARRDILGHGK